MFAVKLKVPVVSMFLARVISATFRPAPPALALPTQKIDPAAAPLVQRTLRLIWGVQSAISPEVSLAGVRAGRLIAV